MTDRSYNEVFMNILLVLIIEREPGKNKEYIYIWQMILFQNMYNEFVRTQNAEDKQ